MNESPFSIQICLRKRFLKDAPKQLKSDYNSAARVESIEKKCEVLAAENVSLVNALEEANTALQSSTSTNEILHSKIDKAEEEVFKYQSDKKEIEAKAKIMIMN